MHFSQQITSMAIKVARTVRAMLREIFDETAYERYLARTCSERSKESYRSFLDERQTSMARKPRCC